jgi:hypothetical protein
MWHNVYRNLRAHFFDTDDCWLEDLLSMEIDFTIDYLCEEENVSSKS